MRSLHIDWGQGRIDKVSGLILDDRLFFPPPPCPGTSADTARPPHAKLKHPQEDLKQVDSYFSYQTDENESDGGSESCVNSLDLSSLPFQVPPKSNRKGEAPAGGPSADDPLLTTSIF